MTSRIPINASKVRLANTLLCSRYRRSLKTIPRVDSTTRSFHLYTAGCVMDTTVLVTLSSSEEEIQLPRFIEEGTSRQHLAGGN